MSDKVYASVQVMVDDMEICCNCVHEDESFNSKICFPCHIGDENNFKRKVSVGNKKE